METSACEGPLPPARTDLPASFGMQIRQFKTSHPETWRRRDGNGADWSPQILPRVFPSEPRLGPLVPFFFLYSCLHSFSLSILRTNQETRDRRFCRARGEYTANYRSIGLGKCVTLKPERVRVVLQCANNVGVLLLHGTSFAQQAFPPPLLWRKRKLFSRRLRSQKRARARGSSDATSPGLQANRRRPPEECNFLAPSFSRRSRRRYWSRMVNPFGGARSGGAREA